MPCSREAICINALFARSIIRPCLYNRFAGPLSVTVTITDFPVLALITLSLVPNLKSQLAQVNWSSLNSFPLAIINFPDSFRQLSLLYQLAVRIRGLVFFVGMIEIG